MDNEILVIAKMTCGPFNRIAQLLVARGFSVAICCSLAEAMSRFPVPGSFRGLALIDSNILPLSIYEFCPTYKVHFADALLVFTADQAVPTVRSYVLCQGAAELLSASSVADAFPIVNQIQALLRGERVPTPPTPPRPAAEPVAGGPGRPAPTVQPVPSAQITVQVALSGLHQLSHLANIHFGKFVVVNYWQVTRQNLPELAGCLNLFAVEYNADIGFKPARLLLTPPEVLALRRWAAAFIERCQLAMPEFPLLLEEADLNLYEPRVPDPHCRQGAPTHVHCN